MTPKAFHIISAQIGSVSTRVDKSVGFRVTTGELKPDMMAQLCGLSGLAVSLFIQPHEYDGKDAVEVTSETESKTQGQRLRGVLYRLWEHRQKNEDKDNLISFADYYKNKTEEIITFLKTKLPPMD